MSEKYTFEDFLACVDGKHQKFVRGLHEELTAYGCKAEVKSVKSGYVASYSLHKKIIANYVFRTKGVVVRIYANHLAEYADVLNILPKGMAQTIREAPVCKRLIDPTACNPNCAMGYDVILKEELMQKCRHNAFLFLITEESGPFVRLLLLNEAKAAV